MKEELPQKMRESFFMKGDSWIMTSVDGSVVGTDTYEEAKPFIQMEPMRQ